MKIGSKIREIRLQKGMTLAEVENRANIANGNLSRIERGVQWLTEQKFTDLAGALGVTVADFFGGGQHGIHVYTSADQNVTDVVTRGKLPLISSVQAGEWSDIVDQFQVGDAEDWIPCPFNHGPNAFILRVEGYSMYNPGGDKSYAPGEFIAVDPGVEPQNKKMVVVRIDNEEKATFKQLLMDADGEMVLQALNPSHAPRFMTMPEGSRIVGVVIGKWMPE